MLVDVLLGLESVFSLWMLVDAAQRGAAMYWYPIIFLPFGQLAYFFTVKVHDPEFRTLRLFFASLFKPKVTLEQLRYRAKETPSFANKLALVQAIHDAQLYVEAVRGFDELLAKDDECKDALYGRALCQLELQDYKGAIEALRQLLVVKPSYEEYDGWARLAYALRKTDQHDAALDLLGELVRKAPRTPHRVLYAQYLAEAHKDDEACEQLRLALQAHEHAPRFQKRRDAGAAKAARNLLARLAAS
jgi:hypothetical protein